ncbi:hypothetical protein FE257_005038 [Aspergillus nanangensis]|uniref:Fe2OG dioxygenase domain-containing protein n=1 Tax=Aspergillus nanangensis TaxID=2582783 RepID=A0AAD4GVR4_ASPNN|nr:hypothetical protein FE257_005038 [Aspergillus nanangensis]
MSSKRRKVSSRTTFKKTMGDVETEVKRLMVETCKLDACVFLFFDSLREILPYRPGRLVGPPQDFETLQVTNKNKWKSLVQELKQNVNLLLPGYLQNDQVLRDQRVIERLRQRWIHCEDHYEESDEEIDEGTDEKSNEESDECKNRSARKSRSSWQSSDLGKALTDTVTNLMSIQSANEETQAGPTESSLTQTAFREACHQLQGYIGSEKATALFVCGGSISIEGSEKHNERQLISSPVHIYWAIREDIKGHLVLPLDEKTPGSNSDALGQLVRDCDPASFGQGQQDIIDPEYRRAGKLDPCKFSTNFDWPRLGKKILNNVQDILLPGISTKIQNSLQLRELRAELYKLNIYSGPSGLFKKHVDTPRDENQIGSLVVCLPSSFQGGDLVVRHGGKEMTFAWSGSSGSAIQWAAFYSDCEHEIKTITDGQRITLTYNLYVEELVGGSIPPGISIDPRTLPLYDFMKGLLHEPGFMKHGGTLGIYCSHAYPHSSPLAKQLLPRILKGSDLVVYSVLESLGATVGIRPVIRNTNDSEDKYTEEDASESQQEYLRTGQEINIFYKDLHSILPLDMSDVHHLWKSLLYSRQPMGLSQTRTYAQEHGLQVNENDSSGDEIAKVGTELHAYFTSTRGQEEEIDNVISDIWSSGSLPGIIWINKPAHKEMAFSYLAYGNEATIGTVYSNAAIIAVVPPFNKRSQILAML